MQMAALLGVVVIAYNYSLTTLLQLADLNTPLAYVSLVPIIALDPGRVHSRPSQPEPSIHDRQTDYIVGVPLMVAALCANLFLPSKLSAMFWVWRIDLLTLPFFVAGAVAVIFGVRVLWRQKLAVAFLFLAWPYPYTTVLLGVLNAFTTATLFAMTEILNVVHVATPSGRAEQRRVHGGARWSSVHPECGLGLFGCEQCRGVPPGRRGIRGRHPGAVDPQAPLAGRGHGAALDHQPGSDHPDLLGGPAVRGALRHRRAPPLHRAGPFSIGCGDHDPVHQADGAAHWDIESRVRLPARACGASTDLGEAQTKRNLAVPSVYLAMALVLWCSGSSSASATSGCSRTTWWPTCRGRPSSSRTSTIP